MTKLVLLPGMDGTGELFEPFIAALGPELKVQVIRYPSDEPLDYAALTTFVRGTLTDDEPCVLLGESFSGPIAISLAASGMPKLKGLILCCSFARNPRPALKLLRPLIGLVPIHTSLTRLATRWLLGRHASEALRCALDRAVDQVLPSVLRARLRAILSVDVTPLLSRIAVPTCYLRATEDRVVPPSASKLILKHKPNMDVVAIKAPHGLLQSQPLAAARAVSAFLGRLSDAPAKKTV